MTMTKKNLLTFVAESPIHGKGLFALQNISADTVIGKLAGKKTQQDGMYVLWLDNETGFKVSCDLKYINHSDTPNACYYDDLSVVALRNINKDEEITHNYEADW
ncbi:MAG: SET domain-containing protein [Gammaproteobacteria bacterium]|nr:SET domain-containing protein [Gammaproteobacteria bacterium]